MRKSILYFLLCFLFCYSSKAEEKIYSPETKDIITECTGENYALSNNKAENIIANCTTISNLTKNNFSDYENHQQMQNINLCLKNEIKNYMRQIFTHKYYLEAEKHLELSLNNIQNFYNNIFTDNKFVSEAGSLDLLRIDTAINSFLIKALKSVLEEC